MRALLGNGGGPVRSQFAFEPCTRTQVLDRLIAIRDSSDMEEPCSKHLKTACKCTECSFDEMGDRGDESRIDQHVCVVCNGQAYNWQQLHCISLQF